MAIIGAAAVLVAGVAVYSLSRGPDYPDHWDPRVLDLVDFVEAHRGLDFEHPVAVDFLTDEDYSKLTRTDEADLTDDDRASLAHQEGFFRALGLLAGDVDLFEAGNTLQDDGTLAFYSPTTNRVTVRGLSLTVELRVTVVHELTHALQDQYFDLEAMQDVESDGEAFAARALIEGDAVRVENEYVDQLSDSERDEYESAQPTSVEEAGLGDVPVTLVALFGAPYQFGLPFVYLLDARGGQSDIDDAFYDPPTSEEHLLDPYSFVTGDDPAPLDEIDPDRDVEVVESGDFGALGLYLMLAERIDPLVALHAVDGWRGDAYAAYERDGAICIDARIATDTTADLDELHAALDQWDAALADDAVAVHRSGDDIAFTACDPGADDAPAVTGTGADALVLPEVRSYEFGKALGSGLEDEDARCFSQQVVEHLTIAELIGEEELSDEHIGAVEDAAVVACGLG